MVLRHFFGKTQSFSVVLVFIRAFSGQSNSWFVIGTYCRIAKIRFFILRDAPIAICDDSGVEFGASGVYFGASGVDSGASGVDFRAFRVDFEAPGIDFGSVFRPVVPLLDYPVSLDVLSHSSILILSPSDPLRLRASSASAGFAKRNYTINDQ